MGAVRGRGQQRTGHFVFALGAAFKALHPVGNAPLNRLVITSLEMQAVHSGQCPPITPIRHAGLAAFIQVQTDQADADGLACVFSHKQQPMGGHVLSHGGKKFRRQIRRIAMLPIGLLVAAHQQLPVCVRHLRAAHGPKSHTGLLDFAAFLADFFAFFLLKTGQKIFEISPPRVLPMKLNLAALLQPGIQASALVLGTAKKNVQRRQALALAIGQQCRQQSFSRCLGLGQ